MLLCKWCLKATRVFPMTSIDVLTQHTFADWVRGLGVWEVTHTTFVGHFQTYNHVIVTKCPVT